MLLKYFSVEVNLKLRSCTYLQVLVKRICFSWREIEKNISEEPSPPVFDGRPVSGGAPLYYGFIPSALIFVILIVLYTTINGINKPR